MENILNQINLDIKSTKCLQQKCFSQLTKAYDSQTQSEDSISDFLDENLQIQDFNTGESTSFEQISKGKFVIQNQYIQVCFMNITFEIQLQETSKLQSKLEKIFSANNLDMETQLLLNILIWQKAAQKNKIYNEKYNQVLTEYRVQKFKECDFNDSIK